MNIVAKKVPPVHKYLPAKTVLYYFYYMPHHTTFCLRAIHFYSFDFHTIGTSFFIQGARGASLVARDGYEC